MSSLDQPADDTPGPGKPGARRATIADVARAAGVSPTTVSLVIQGKGRISKSTIAAVQRAIDRLGYVYDRRAASLRKRSTRLIGVVINDLSNPFFAELAAGVESVLGERGFLPLIGNSQDDVGRQRELLTSMVEHGAAGFILSTAHAAGEDDFAMIQALHAPCVLCVRDPHVEGYDYVGTDNYRGAVLAMEHLLSQGHRRIAFVGGVKGATPRADRFAAYAAALESRSVPIDGELVVACRANRESGRAAVATLRKRGARYTAAICYNDVVAFGFCIGLRDVGHAAGRDVAVVGFDNLPESEAWIPPLSTVEMQPRTIGTEAAGLMLRRIEDPSSAPVRLLLPPQLIVRASTTRCEPAGGAGSG